MAGRMEAKFGGVVIVFDLPADHTYVSLFDDANNKIQDFGCFGGTSGTKMSIKGAVSNAHTVLSVFNHKVLPWNPLEVPPRGTLDSTHIYYLFDGVCHQAANRFLLPARCVMPDVAEGPRGVTITYFTFGFHGALPNYLWWRKAKYEPACKYYHFPCGNEVGKSGAATPEEEMFVKLEALYQESANGKMASNTLGIDFIIKQSGLYMESKLSGLNGNPAADLQRQYLEERASYLAKKEFLDANFFEGARGMRAISVEEFRDLVQKSNDWAIQFQRELCTTIGRDAFVKLTNSEEPYPLTTPELAAFYLKDYIQG